MALTFTQLTTNNSITSTATFDVPGVTAAIGDLLVLVVGADNAGTAGVSALGNVTDSAGNTWINWGATNQTPTAAAGDGATLCFYTSRLTAALSAGTVTVALSPNVTAKVATLCKFTGNSPSILLVGPGVTGQGTLISSGTIAAVPSGVSLICAIAVENNASGGADSDTTLGSWVAASQPTANTGVALTSITMTRQHKSTTGAGDQVWDVNVGGTVRDYALNWLIVFEAAGAVTAAGVGDLLAIGAATGAGAVAAAGIGAATFDGVGLTTVSAVLSAPGLGSASFTAVYTSPGAVSAAGRGAAAFLAGKDPRIADNIKRVYASAPAGQRYIETLELAHPAFPATFYITNAPQPWTFDLGDGTLQLFQPVAFRITLPKMDGKGQQDLQLVVDNVGRVAMEALEAAAAQPRVPIVVTVRVYLNVANTKPQNKPPLVLTLGEVEVTPPAFAGTASRSDTLNRHFPSVLYRTDVFPGLDR
jgi:hypothetical protein